MSDASLKSFTKNQKIVLGSTMSGLGAQGMNIMLLSFALSSIIVDLNINSTQAGLISTITNFGMLFGGILFGVVADKYSKVKMFVFTVLLFSISTFLIAFSTNVYMLFLLRFLAGMGAGGEYGVGMALLADAFTKKTRGRVTSYVTIGGQMGSIVAAIGAAIILPQFGWRGLFVIGILPIFLALYAWKNLKETKQEENMVKEEKVKIPISELFSSKQRAITTITLTIMATVQVAGYFGLMNWLPSILQKRLGLSVSGSSLWMISTIIGMCLGMLLFGQIMDRIGPKFAYSLFLLASAGAVFIYVYASSAIAILIGGSIVGFFANGMNAGYGAIIGNLYPSHIRSTANNLIFNLGRAIGGFSSVVIGFMLDHYSLTAAMIFLSTLYVISFVCVQTLNNDVLKKGVTE
ncbi:MFS transporter [Bacillus chungangensis]|uniref:MFS family permease n=1 Tax=Bacillus chungangensis TaxID=587633 RepID=A0ABT9WUP9_9BACI|nr:MFS transporter [Bacillus chungangensis]MDQ0176838.1 MFS family permease [Bacillus chungangensis]